MKLTYGFIFDDFRTLFPPATKLRKSKPGLYFGILMGGLLCVLGILMAIKAMEWADVRAVPEGTIPQAAITVLLGATIIAVCIFRERQIDAKLRKQYESAVQTKFKDVHCRTNRTIAVSPEGIEMSCACGSTIRPWSEVAGFTEGPLFFQITTRKESHLIPKRAFASESERTQFRALFSDHVQVAPVLSGTRIQFVRTKADARHARVLHLKQGLTLKQKLNIVATCLLTVLVGFYMAKLISGSANFASGAGASAILLSARFLPWFKRKGSGYFGPLTASFNSDGIQLQDPASTAMYRWSDFRGYARDSSYWLLYHKNNSYRAFPRRAFQANQASEFNQLVEQNLQPVTTAAR